jgi:hypothetical protein
MAIFPIATVFAISAFLAIVASDSDASSFENVFGGVDYFHYSGRDDQASYNSYKFRMGSNVINENVSVDLMTEFGDEVNSPNSYNQLEVGLKGSWAIPMSDDLFGLYARGAVGQNWNSGESNFPYWSIEPGVVLNVSEDVTGNVGYRYRNAFDDDEYTFETNAAIVGVEWMVVENHGVNFGYEYSAKDQKYDMIGIGYTFNF